MTAKALGTATISVTTQDGNFSDSVLVTVSSQPQVTSITGSFYNTNGNNNGGDNGVTVTNLNNGISSVNALGFGGTTVVTDVVVTQGYFPRSNGLALGSSSSSGSLKLALAEAYHAYKVDVLFNAAGISGTTVGVTGNGGVKTSTSGTIGTAGSNPSSGTPYSVEFTNPSSEITITTSNRTAIVSIVIQYANDTSGDTSHIEATTWADNFLAMTHDGCAAFSRDELTQVWDDAAISFNALSSEAKAIISGTTPNGDGDDIEEAVARYVVIVTNYQLSEFIPGVLITQPSRTVYEISPENKTFTIVGGLTLLGLVIGFIFVDKKLRKTY